MAVVGGHNLGKGLWSRWGNDPGGTGGGLGGGVKAKVRG